jgi:hypothetical protein
VLEVLFGGKTAEQTLLYLHNYDEGYARAIAETFGVSLSSVQKQLQKFETGGVLVSRPVGKTRVYAWNPRYPFQEKLRSLLAETFRFMPEDEIQTYYRERRRPRRAGKPL